MVQATIACLVTNPVDVVKTRIMNMKSAADGAAPKYRGMADCFLKMLRTEGPWAGCDWL